MALTTTGATLIAQMVRGASVTAFNAANAYIGLGTSTTAFSVGQTDLVAVASPRKGMDSGYPSGAAAVLTYQATFGTADSNGVIEEWGLFNAVTGGTMLGRKVESLGEKLNTQSWTVQVTATFAAA